MEPLSPGLVAELAYAASSFDEVEVGVLDLLEHHVGADTAFFIDARGPTRTVRGVVAAFDEDLRRWWPSIARTDGARSLVEAARAGNGVVVDSELFGTALRKQEYYALIMAPVRGTSTMFSVLPHRGHAKTELVLGRCVGSRTFSEREKELVASLVPTLSLAVLAHQTRSDVPALAAPSLTMREREVLSYLHLGYTNRQIGEALGTRERTVRNQLSSIYDKLGVGSRAEAVGLSSSRDAQKLLRSAASKV